MRALPVRPPRGQLSLPGDPPLSQDSSLFPGPDTPSPVWSYLPIPFGCCPFTLSAGSCICCPHSLLGHGSPPGTGSSAVTHLLEFHKSRRSCRSGVLHLCVSLASSLEPRGGIAPLELLHTARLLQGFHFCSFHGLVSSIICMCVVRV